MTSAPIRWRDLAERTFWSAVAAGLTAVPAAAVLNVATWEMAAAAAATAVVTAGLAVARYRLSVLPDPGTGMPGLPVSTTQP